MDKYVAINNHQDPDMRDMGEIKQDFGDGTYEVFNLNTFSTRIYKEDELENYLLHLEQTSRPRGASSAPTPSHFFGL